MNIIDAIANDPSVSPEFRRALPTKAQTARWYELQAAIAANLTPEESAELKRDKEDSDRRERVLGDDWAERFGGI